MSKEDDLIIFLDIIYVVGFGDVFKLLKIGEFSVGIDEFVFGVLYFNEFVLLFLKFLLSLFLLSLLLVLLWVDVVGVWFGYREEDFSFFNYEGVLFGIFLFLFL